MASSISAGTTSSTALVATADTSGALVLQTNNGTTALTLSTAQNATFAGTLATSSRGIAAASMPAGSVLQVVSTNKSSETATSSTTFTDASLSLSITPTSSTSKIFIIYTGSAGNDGSQESNLTLVRNSTNIGDSTRGLMRIWFNGSSSYHFGGMSMSILDSPATTSATTYKVQFKTGSGIVYICGGNATDTLTAWEIAA